MGLFGLFSKKKQLPELEPKDNHLAFVLLPEAQLPTAEDVIAAFDRFRGASETLIEASDEDADADAEESSESALVLHLEGIGAVLVALMPVPIPDGEAEQAFDFSIASMSEGAKLEDHSAHLLVTLMGVDEGASPVAGIMAFTSVLAALAAASSATGVYWGNGGVSHPSEFFLAIAEEHGIMPRVMLWNGISRASESDGKLSILSLGMSQIALPDLYLITPAENAGMALERFFELLAYIADRGEAIPDGDTIGATEHERIKVTYTESPAGDGSVVWMVRL